MLKYFNKREKGFTLIELMIVIAIIGVLAAIAIPQFNAYRRRGFRASIVSDARNAMTGVMAYAAEHPGTTPPAEQILPGNSGATYTTVRASVGNTINIAQGIANDTPGNVTVTNVGNFSGNYVLTSNLVVNDTLADR